DEEQATGLIALLTNLRAKEFAAYGPKADLAAFGLEKPALTLTVTVQPPAEKDKTAKPRTHTLALGKAVKDAAGERYARLDDGPAVAVLDGTVVKELSQSYLDFVNRDVLKLNPDQVTELKRQMNNAEALELVKKDKAWRLIKPLDTAADRPS